MAAGLVAAASAAPAGAPGARLGAALTQEQAAQWKPGMRAPRRYSDGRLGEVGFAVVDASGRLHQEHGYSTAPMASTFKVMLLVAYLRKARDRELNSYNRSLLRPMIRQAFFLRRLRDYVPNRHWDFARRQLARIVERQRWGVGRVDLHGWKLYFKGGWGSGSGAVDHQVALLGRGGYRIGLAILTEGNPSHAYGKETLEGVARRLLRGLPR